jgi:hypothetical protein
MARAAVPIVLGIAGFAKLGSFHWGLFAVVVILAIFAYRSGYSKAKYGTPAVKSLLFGDIPAKPPRR